MATLAGALNTPTRLSVSAKTPARCPDGGTMIVPGASGLPMTIRG